MAISKGTQYITDPDSIPVNTSTGAQTIDDALNDRGIWVEDLTALKAIPLSGLVANQKATITTTGRAGDFTWLAGDRSSTLVLSTVTSDSVDSGTDTVTATAHGLLTGDGVTVDSNVNGLTANTVYWVIKVDADNFQLASSYSDAKNGTAIDLTAMTAFSVYELRDPMEGIYVTLDGDRRGINGAFLRSYNLWGTGRNPLWFGAEGDGSTVDTTSIVSSIVYGPGKITFPDDKSFYLPAGSETVDAYGQSQGDPAFDIQSLYAVLIDGMEGLEIDAGAAHFVTDYGAPIVFYRCQKSRWRGGLFTRNGTDTQAINNEASAIIITRSYDVYGETCHVDGYYRNLYVYRAPNCGFINQCESVNALYYNYYGASVLDVTLSGVTLNDTRAKIVGNYARGGRFGNIFCDNTQALLNESHDLSPSGNVAWHIKAEQGNYVAAFNRVYENSNQNSGDIISGILASKTTAATDDVENVKIVGNEIVGCYQGYRISGVEGFEVTGNSCRDYYQTGMILVTENVGGNDSNVRDGIVTGNRIGNMNDASTRSNSGNNKNAGLSIEENNSLAFENVYIGGNTVDALGDNTTKTPTYGVYAEITEGGIIWGDNAFHDNIPNQLPDGYYRTGGLYRSETFTSAGSGSSPSPVSISTVRDGGLTLFNSYVELPAAAPGMRCSVMAGSSTVHIYLNGATDSTTSSDTMRIPSAATKETQRKIEFNGPGVLILLTDSSGNWYVHSDSGTSVTVTT